MTTTMITMTILISIMMIMIKIKRIVVSLMIVTISYTITVLTQEAVDWISYIGTSITPGQHESERCAAVRDMPRKDEYWREWSDCVKLTEQTFIKERMDT